MRITQNTLTRNYLRGLNRNLSKLAESNHRMTTQRKFSKVSENTADAARAFQVREQLYKYDQNLTNIRDAQGELTSAESNLITVNGVLQSTESRMIQGINGTIPADKREMIAREIGNLKEQLVQLGNAKYGDKYLFGGSNNSGPPFTLEGDAVMFNGIDVSKIVRDPYTNKPCTVDEKNPDNYIPIPENSEVYIDVGLGLTMSGANLDTKTGLKVSTSGLDAFGFGSTMVDGAELPNNIIALLGKISKDFSDNDMVAMDKNLTHLQSISDGLMMNVTDIGNRATFLDQTADRLDTDIFNLKSTQNDLEIVSLEEESINNKSYDMAWKVTLQLGSKILPPSIFDFMR